MVNCIACGKPLENEESMTLHLGPICRKHYEIMKKEMPELTIKEFAKKKKLEEYNNKNKRECFICKASGMETSLWKRSKEWRCKDHKDIEKYPLKIKNKKTTTK